MPACSSQWSCSRTGAITAGVFSWSQLHASRSRSHLEMIFSDGNTTVTTASSTIDTVATSESPPLCTNASSSQHPTVPHADAVLTVSFSATCARGCAVIINSSNRRGGEAAAHQERVLARVLEHVLAEDGVGGEVRVELWVFALFADP